MDENEAETLKEQRDFAKSPAMLYTLKAIRERLGFDQEEDEDSTGDVSISLKEVLVMYEVCRFERAKEPEEPSPWCAAFDEDDLTVKKTDMA